MSPWTRKKNLQRIRVRPLHSFGAELVRVGNFWATARMVWPQGPPCNRALACPPRLPCCRRPPPSGPPWRRNCPRGSSQLDGLRQWRKKTSGAVVAVVAVAHADIQKNLHLSILGIQEHLEAQEESPTAGHEPAENRLENGSKFTN